MNKDTQCEPFYSLWKRTIKSNHIIGCLTQRTDVNAGFCSAESFPEIHFLSLVSHSSHSMLLEMHLTSLCCNSVQLHRPLHRTEVYWPDISVTIASSLKSLWIRILILNQNSALLYLKLKYHYFMFQALSTLYRGMGKVLVVSGYQSWRLNGHTFDITKMTHSKLWLPVSLSFYWQLTNNYLCLY